MRYPEFIKAGDTIGFVAPSFGCAMEPYISAFESAVDYFKDNGYKIKKGPNVYEGSGVGISNTPKECGSELTDMYCDNTSKLLLSCGGGELMCEILPHMNLERIGESIPKWFGGYSDNTNFTFINTVINDVATIYGPCAGAFGMRPFHQCILDYYRILTGDFAGEDNDRFITFRGYDKWEKESLKSPQNPLATINDTEKSAVKAYVGNIFLADDSDIRSFTGKDRLSFSGRMIGGCMDVLVNLLGTRFDKVSSFLEKYKEDGFIWFLESCDLNVFSIRRAMWQMEQAGWFKYVKGFVIGRPLVMGQEMMGLDQYQAVLGIIGKMNVPVLMDIDIGHISPSMPVICGSIGEVTYHTSGYSITYHLK